MSCTYRTIQNSRDRKFALRPSKASKRSLVVFFSFSKQNTGRKDEEEVRAGCTYSRTPRCRYLMYAYVIWIQKLRPKCSRRGMNKIKKTAEQKTPNIWIRGDSKSLWKDRLNHKHGFQKRPKFFNQTSPTAEWKDMHPLKTHEITSRKLMTATLNWPWKGTRPKKGAKKLHICHSARSVGLSSFDIWCASPFAIFIRMTID